jgi:peptidyl-tRNA hydrolase
MSEIREDSPRDQIVDYVLQPFRQDEQPVIDEALKRAGDAITLIVTDDVDGAMNVYNPV